MDKGILKNIIQKVHDITTYEELEDIPSHVEELLGHNLIVQQVIHEIREVVSATLEHDFLNRDDWVCEYAQEQPFEDDYDNMGDYSEALLEWESNVDIDYQSYVEDKEQELVEVKGQLVDLLETCVE